MEIADDGLATAALTAPQRAALDVLRLVVAAQNTWMDEQVVELREARDAMKAQVFPRMPRVIPGSLPPLTTGETRALLAVLTRLRQDAVPPRGARPRPRRMGRGQHRCFICQGFGHYRTTCPLRERGEDD